MADLRTLQAAFTAGELGPALWARVDLSKYGSGLKTALNVFVHPHGGASNGRWTGRRWTKRSCVGRLVWEPDCCGRQM